MEQWSTVDVIDRLSLYVYQLYKVVVSNITRTHVQRLGNVSTISVEMTFYPNSEQRRLAEMTRMRTII